MNGDPLTVHDIQVQTTNMFTQSGQVKKISRLTFYVGTHGPFSIDYDPDQATSERMQADINHQVVELRRLTTAQYGG